MSAETATDFSSNHFELALVLITYFNHNQRINQLNTVVDNSLSVLPVVHCWRSNRESVKG